MKPIIDLNAASFFNDSTTNDLSPQFKVKD